MNWFTNELLTAAGSVIDGWAWLNGEASGLVINKAANVTRNRPHPFSTASEYTSWRSLTDRTYFARHLPPKDVPVQPLPAQVQALFTRPAGTPGRLSNKSTLLFPAFAQYLTDGFIRTDPLNPRCTTTNHEIDLCPLYGRTIPQTDALRRKSEAAGDKGKLKSQFLGEEEYSPFLFPNGDRVPDPAFKDLDPPLLKHGVVSATPPDDISQARLDTMFAAGGDRVNTTPFSAMMNTLLLREHNRIAGELEARNPSWDDERVFQTARNIMIPVFIKIVVEQYINHITPLPFGIRVDPKVAWDAKWNRPNWITAEFSLLYRWHSLMPDTIQWPTGVIDTGKFTVDNKPLLDIGLHTAFAAAAAQPAGELGALNTTASLLNVESFAVRQARCNKIATYNDYRAAFGMDRAESFDEISRNPAVAAILQTLYGTPENVEFYPGLFAEDRVADSPLPGLLLRMVAVDAFTQALTNPLLSEHVFNETTFTEWGFDLIHSTSKLGDLLQRQKPGSTLGPIEMTQAGWHYGIA